MTGRALGTQCATMDVILAMTVDTGCGRLAIRHIGAMAAGTCDGEVSVLQREIRQVVREAGLIELVDVGVATQVLGVTTAALAGGSLWHAAVISRLGADIGGDFLVAVEAQGGLALPVGTVVAITALAFDLGVGLGDRPGHDELFDVRGVRRRSEQRGD